MVDTIGLTLEVISRPYKLEFSIEVIFFFKLCHFIPFLSLLLDYCTDMFPFIQVYH